MGRLPVSTPTLRPLFVVGVPRGYRVDSIELTGEAHTARVSCAQMCEPDVLPGFRAFVP